MKDPQNKPEVAPKVDGAKGSNAISEKVQAMSDNFKNFAQNAKNQNPDMEKMETFVDGAIENLLMLVPSKQRLTLLTNRIQKTLKPPKFFDPEGQP